MRRTPTADDISLETPSTASRLVATGNFCDKSPRTGAVTETFGRREGKDSGVVLELSQSPVEAPDELVRRLVELQLCRPADFRRARACVRRLSRDLPTFDSVWIDALVQLHKLTPHQARMLENGSGHQLLVGGCVVVDELGRGPHGTTLLARTAARKGRVVLKRLKIAVESLPDCRQRLTQFIERGFGWSHPNLVVPQRLLTGTDPELVVASRWVPGLTLTELLIRRGRFPAPIVLEIARQLASALSALHGHGLVHGDIRLSNVRLTLRGLAVLVDGGIRPAVCPELTIHETLALDAYDGVAPELIGTGISPNAGSEIYSLGCLLWQLLAGRPPYPMADPLMKLAAHQTQRIADVRIWAPDTPAVLAESIAAMTSPDVNQRPRSFDDLSHRWGRPGLTSRSRLRRYRKKFDGAVPHFIQPGGRPADSRWPWVAVLLFVAAGMALTFADKGLRNELLSVTRRVADAIQSRQTSATTTDASTVPKPGANPGATADRGAGGLLPLPPPWADGDIVLTEAGPYDVAQLAAAARLTIRAAPNVHPVIQIGRTPLWLAGETVTLENVTVQCESPAGEPPPAMVLVKSQQLMIKGCVFQRTMPAAEQDAERDAEREVGRDAGPLKAASLQEAERRAVVAQNSTVVAWRPMETGHADREQWRVDVSNTIFRTAGAALWSAEMPHHVTVSNCLKLGDGACFAVSPKAAAHPSAFELNKLTLRDGGPLLRLAGTYAEQATAPAIEFTANDCVFALASAGSGLIELQSPRPRTDPGKSVRMTGHGSVLGPGLNLMVLIDPSGQSARQVADADEQFEGIAVSELEFAGPSSGPTGNSRLERFTAPRSDANARPGIDTNRLPAIRQKSPVTKSDGAE
jgi:hypothetical protein